MRLAPLAAEFLLVFCALPLAVAYPPLGLPQLPTLWVIALACGVVLLGDRTFDRKRLWDLAAAGAALGDVGRRGFLALVALTAIVGLASPERLLELPRERPLAWATLLVAYPVVSAWPQELVFRAFLLHRYRPIFGDGVTAIAASAVAFSYMHLVYMNFPALMLSLPAGALLAITYRRTGSLLAATVEHALYGILVFTLGLGRYFGIGGP
jgi:membrane protease YdiL (CAAX protease family)